jgi:hypothetical protein
LRVTERLPPQQIRHIPRILYHWRALEGSTARAMDEKNYASHAQRRALEEHYRRMGENVSLRPVGDFWNAEYDLGGRRPPVSLIVDARGNRAEAWSDCLPRLLANTPYPELEIVVCHDQGAVPALPAAAIATLACLPADSAGDVYQRAFRATKGEYVGIFTHPSWPAEAGWLDTLVGYGMRQSTGAVSPKIVTTDGRIAFAGTLLGIGGGVAFPYVGQRQDVLGQAGRARLAQNFQALAGGFILVRRDTLQQVGGFDALGASRATTQIALCLRLRDAGFWNVWVPNKMLLTSSMPDYTIGPEDVALLKSRWPAALARDPAYHPDLSDQNLFVPA